MQSAAAGKNQIQIINLVWCGQNIELNQGHDQNNFCIVSGYDLPDNSCRYYYCCYNMQDGDEAV